MNTEERKAACRLIFLRIEGIDRVMEAEGKVPQYTDLPSLFRAVDVTGRSSALYYENGDINRPVLFAIDNAPNEPFIGSGATREEAIFEALHAYALTLPPIQEKES